jgi:hypothetical protein
VGRLVVLCAAFAAAGTLAACQDYVCSFPKESPSGIRGRLWLNPNPIVFPAIGPEERVFLVVVVLANIGSEDVLIDSIDFSGDRDFVFEDQHLVDQLCPAEFSGSEECDKVSSVPGTISYAPTTGLNASGTLAIHTSDPTSPTLRVPVIVDPAAEIPKQVPVYPEVTCPVVKPNPIRFGRMAAGGTQTLDVCVRFEGGGPHGRLTRLEAFGSDYHLQQATDRRGDSICLPVEDYPIGQESISVRLANRPVSDQREGGTLLVQTVDDLGAEYTLLVPILETI